MSWNFKKSVVCVTLVSVCGIASGFSCPPVLDAVWQAAIASATSTIGAAVTAAGESIAAGNALNMERILSALRVATKQISVSTDKEITTDLNVRQAVSMAAADSATRKAMFNAIMDFNPATGQGVDPCGELSRSQTMAVSMSEASNDMREKVLREMDNAPGAFVADQGAILAKRIVDGKTKYCTADEVKAGVCSAVGPVAGKDVDAASFFTSAPVSSDQAAAKSAMLNYMFGVPYVAPNKDALSSASGKSFLDAKRSEDAYRSVSQASFKAIQSWTESRGTPEAPQPSVLDALAKKVGVYSGGDNYDAWEQGQASQTERGLLVQYAKMAAMELYLLHTEYQQTERIEANVSALYALRTRNSRSLDAAAGNARNATAQGKVK